MSLLEAPITVSKLVDLARTLSDEDRRKLLVILRGEAFERILAEEDARRSGRLEVTDEEIQAEVDAVRERWYREERRAASG